jgi:lactate permease
VDPAHLPLDLLHWLISLVPIAVLMILLLWRSWKGIEAGPAAMLVAALISLLIFQAPMKTIAVATAKGMWNAVFILYVVWAALLLYLVTLRSGAFDALRRGFMEFSRNELFLVLAIGWVFSTFFQGVAGFGAPIAVTAPLLVGIGMKPVYAVLIPLIAHTFAKMFGTLGVGWLAMLRVAEVSDPLRTAVEAAILLGLVNLLGGLFVTWIYGRWRALLHGMPLILIITAIHGGVQLGMMYVNQTLSMFIAGTVCLVALFPLSRWQRYAEPPASSIDSAIMKYKPSEPKTAASPEPGQESEMGLGLALLPYIFMTIIALLASGVGPINEVLRQFRVGLSFPALETGFDRIIAAATPYSPFALFTHPGTYVMVTALVSLAIYWGKGFYKPAGPEEPSLLANLIKDSVPSSIAIASFMVMSKLMDYSGQTSVLALGIASVASVHSYAFLAGWVGILGGFLTFSSTAANILFSQLQVQAAEALPGLKVSTVLAAQAAGGTVGTVIAPANIVIGTGALRIVGQEGTIMRYALQWVAGTGVIVGIATIILNLF